MNNKNQKKPIKVYFKTYGCSINQSDSETMAGVLEKKSDDDTNDNYNNDYEITVIIKESEADIIVVNSCTVKSATINNVVKYVEEKSKTKAVVMAGCLSQIDQSMFKDKNIIGIKHIDKIRNAVINAYENIEDKDNSNRSKINDTDKREKVINLVHENDGFKKIRLALPIKKKNDVIEIIPISNGCLGECTYCSVRFARGDFFSYPKKDILRRVSEALDGGSKEIWITSQDTGCYGKEIKTDFVSLLEEILEENVGRDYFIRIGMINPQHVMDNTRRLAKVLNHKNMFKFLHIPLQSGNDRILKLMKRKYTAKEFKEIVEDIKKLVPGITIATDVICGFPTETEDEFNDTMKIIGDLEIDVVNISRFGLHKMTESAKLKQVDQKTIKERSSKLTEAFKEISLKNNRKMINRTILGIVDEDKKQNGTFLLRTESYKPVIISKSGKVKFGDILEVKIVEANTFHLVGEI